MAFSPVVVFYSVGSVYCHGRLLILLEVPLGVIQDDNSRSEAPEDGLLYLGIVFFLGIISVYLFLRIKARQVEANRFAMFEKERRVLFDNAPCGYHSVNEEGIVVNINETLLKWLGYEREEIIGKLKFSDLIEAGSQSVNDKIEALSQGMGSTTELCLITKSGDRLPVILGLMKTDSLSTNDSWKLFSTIDNSKCRDALERIKNLDQELEAFSYSISHDLRAPLRSIDGYSKILQEDYAGQLDEEGRRVLNVVMNNARRMGKLIDDLLEFGRVGRKVIQPVNVNMASIVQGIIQDLRSRYPQRTVEVNVGELLTASADADMMRQVWFILLDNAFKYTGKKDVAVIEVRSYSLGDREICYEVRDNGVGFDMMYAGKLFGIFQRLHKVQDFSGTGVGLAMVKRIVSRHAGRAWANATVNGGATFYFTLPVEHENT